MVSSVAIQIIVLNGSSSAGKTTLAQTIQDIMPDPWFHLALDQFRDAMPGRYRGLNSPAGTPGGRGLNVVPMELDGRKVTEVRFGDIGMRMKEGMHRAIAAFARRGNRVIVDDLMLTPGILHDYLLVLADFEALFVGVRCPLITVQERESRRVGRFPGTAESHFDTVHTHGLYDLEIDTSVHSPAACARLVKEFIESGTKPRALATLRERARIRTMGSAP